jgi:hypothetical protein
VPEDDAATDDGDFGTRIQFSRCATPTATMSRTPAIKNKATDSSLPPTHANRFGFVDEVGTVLDGTCADDM